MESAGRNSRYGTHTPIGTVTYPLTPGGDDMLTLSFYPHPYPYPYPYPCPCPYPYP